MILNKQQELYRGRVTSKRLFTLFALKHLPSMVFWGVRVKSLDADQCTVTLPYNSRSKNPFRSIYFSALFGAGELSTGMMVQMLIQGNGKWSMLVVNAEGQFTKKAVGIIHLTCVQGQEIQNQLEVIKREGTGTFTLESIGVDEQGDEVGRYKFTWSLKYKGE